MVGGSHSMRNCVRGPSIRKAESLCFKPYKRDGWNNYPCNELFYLSSQNSIRLCLTESSCAAYKLALLNYWESQLLLLLSNHALPNTSGFILLKPSSPWPHAGLTHDKAFSYLQGYLSLTLPPATLPASGNHHSTLNFYEIGLKFHILVS